jgi:hypothetical protein
MVQVPEDHVVDVVAVRDRVVAAVRTVHVVGLVGAARVVGRARRRVGAADVERVVVDVVAVHVVEVPVVLDGLVAAADGMPVVAVVGVLVVGVVVPRLVAVIVVVVVAPGAMHMSAHRRSSSLPVVRLPSHGAMVRAAARSVSTLETVVGVG